jgi:CO/xanthine dehydrogenase Mo-binding subunit
LIVNQTEGGILQSLSWTLYEAVHFDNTASSAPTGRPIRSCASAPSPTASKCMSSTIPARPIWVWRKPRQGPTGGAIANAFRHATGNASTTFPIRAKEVKAVLGI